MKKFSLLLVLGMLVAMSSANVFAMDSHDQEQIEMESRKQEQIKDDELEKTINGPLTADDIKLIHAAADLTNLFKSLRENEGDGAEQERLQQELVNKLKTIEPYIKKENRCNCCKRAIIAGLIVIVGALVEAGMLPKSELLDSCSAGFTCHFE